MTITNGNFPGLNPTKPTMMMTKGSKHNLWDFQVLPDRWQKSHGALIDAQVNDDLLPIIDNMHERLSAATKDRGLSPIGKHQALKSIREEAADDLKKVADKRRPKLEQDLVQAERSIPKADPPRPTDPEAIQLDRETRDRLFDMTPSAREAFCKKAAEEGKLSVVGPALRDPTGQLLRDHVRASVKQAYLRAAHSSAYENVDGIQKVMDLYDQNLRAAAKVIGSAANDHLAALEQQASGTASDSE